MDLKRDIYQELLAWKRRSNHKVLELEGARQVGKTYILEKFARQEYRQFLYINMIGSSGRDFLLCLEKAAAWEPGRRREENPLRKAFQLFDPDFTDSDELLVVIDEIQESAAVYSRIREFARNSWLYLSHQIGYCSMSVDCSNLDIVANCRYYFNDLGVAGHFLRLTGEPDEVIEGVLCENFVYLELVQRIRRQEIAGQAPWFATDKKTSGELDFYVRSRMDNRNYGIEVKRGKNQPATANALLERGKLDYVYLLKNTYGGIAGRRYSVPLYLCGRISFELGKR